MSFINRGNMAKDLHSLQYTIKQLYLEVLAGKPVHEVVPAILPSYSSFSKESDGTVSIMHIFNMVEYLEQTGFDIATGKWKVKATL
jgi:hypothetical protein